MFVRLIKNLGVAGLGLALSLSAAAPFARTPLSRPGNRAPENGVPALASQLNLTPAQVKRLRAMREKNRAEMRRLRGSTLSPEQKRDRMRALRERNRRQLEAILTPAQAARLRTVRATQRARSAGERGPGRGNRQRFALDQLRSRLQLTPAQERKVRQILKDRDTRMKRLRDRRTPTTGTRDPALRAQIRDLNRDTMDKIRALLTEEQRRKARDLTERRRDRAGNRSG